eukprot:g4987.t1
MTSFASTRGQSGLTPAQQSAFKSELRQAMNEVDKEEGLVQFMDRHGGASPDESMLEFEEFGSAVKNLLPEATADHVDYIFRLLSSQDATCISYEDVMAFAGKIEPRRRSKAALRAQRGSRGGSRNGSRGGGATGRPALPAKRAAGVAGAGAGRSPSTASSSLSAGSRGGGGGRAHTGKLLQITMQLEYVFKRNRGALPADVTETLDELCQAILERRGDEDGIGRAAEARSAAVAASHAAPPPSPAASSSAFAAKMSKQSARSAASGASKRRSKAAAATSGGSGGSGGGRGKSSNLHRGASKGAGDTSSTITAEQWQALGAKLPTGSTAADKAKRKKMFRDFDPNGNGYLSLAEVDKGVKDVLKSDQLFDAKPAIMRAFQAAKGAAKTKARLGADFVERAEFKLLLVYLKRYFELFVMFERVDTGDDRRVNLDEFTEALWMIEDWGVTVDDPAAEFARIDRNGGGEVLFDEFCDWAISKHLEAFDHEEHAEEEHDDGGGGGGRAGGEAKERGKEDTAGDARGKGRADDDDDDDGYAEEY